MKEKEGKRDLRYRKVVSSLSEVRKEVVSIGGELSRAQARFVMREVRRLKNEVQHIIEIGDLEWYEREIGTDRKSRLRAR